MRISSKATPDIGLSSFVLPGPASFLSICSNPGIDWVREKTGVSDFGSIAKKLTDVFGEPDNGIMSSRQGLYSWPEPEPQLAWTYVNAFFEEIPFSNSEKLLIVLPRASIEAQLRQQLDGANSGEGDIDVSWFVLRNAIYATGCRSHEAVYGSSSKFVVGAGHGWQFFHRAALAHTELIYGRPNLMALQALLILVSRRRGVISLLGFPLIGRHH